MNLNFPKQTQKWRAGAGKEFLRSPKALLKLAL
jgi:hypothetical protein